MHQFYKIPVETMTLEAMTFLRCANTTYAGIKSKRAPDDDLARLHHNIQDKFLHEQQMSGAPVTGLTRNCEAAFESIGSGTLTWNAATPSLNCCTQSPCPLLGLVKIILYLSALFQNADLHCVLSLKLRVQDK